MPKTTQTTTGSNQFDGTSGAGLLTDPCGGAENCATEIYWLTYHGTGTAPNWTVTAQDTATAGNAPIILSGTNNDLADMVGKRIPTGFSLKFATTNKDATGSLTIGYRVVAEG